MDSVLIYSFKNISDRYKTFIVESQLTSHSPNESSAAGIRPVIPNQHVKEYTTIVVIVLLSDSPQQRPFICQEGKRLRKITVACLSLLNNTLGANIQSEGRSARSKPHSPVSQLRYANNKM